MDGQDIKPSEWVLVKPSIRKINISYLRFVPDEIKIIVVNDSDKTMKPNRKNMEVFDYAFQKKIMASDYDLIPHKTAACRNFAFYYILLFFQANKEQAFFYGESGFPRKRMNSKCCTLMKAFLDFRSLEDFGSLYLGVKRFIVSSYCESKSLHSQRKKATALLELWLFFL